MQTSKTPEAEKRDAPMSETITVAALTHSESVEIVKVPSAVQVMGEAAPGILAIPNAHLCADRLLCEVKAALRPQMPDEVQRELGELLSLMPRIPDDDSMRLGLAEIAVAALFLEQPDIELAKKLRAAIDVGTRRTVIRRFLRGDAAPPTRVMFGLATLLYFFLFMGHNLFRLLFGYRELTQTARTLLVAAGVGALGSIVSMMVRLKDFETVHVSDKNVLFFTGLFKPIIGASFALFVIFVIKSGIIPITVPQGSELHFYAAIAFVSGFSERFAQDIAGRVENSVSAPQAKK